MPAPRILTCLGILALFIPLAAQNPSPTAYTIVETVAFPPIGSTMTIYRSGTKALTDVFRPAQAGTPASHSLTFYDIAKGASWSWDPADKPISCSTGNFSGDWGDPFAMTPDLLKTVAKGDLKPAGTETIAGITAKIYAGVSNSTGPLSASAVR